MKILSFCGKRYTGKDFCADLVTQMDGSFHKVSFAELPKIEFAELVGINVEDLNTPVVKEKYRPAFINFCETKKKEDPAYWAKQLFTLLEDWGNDKYVICDLRFIEECQLIVQNKGVIYKVQANPEVRKARGWVPNPLIDNDRSETEMDLSPYTFFAISKGGGIFNNEQGTDNLIRKQIYDILNRHFV